MSEIMIRLVDLPWNDVVYDHIFCRLDLQDLLHLRGLSADFQALVDNYIVSWRTLDLSSCVNFHPDIFEVLIATCESLRRVNLSNSYWLSGRHLVDLLRKHRNLTHLDLSGCNGIHMTGDFIEFTNSTSIKLRGCAWVNAPFLSTLVDYNSQLEELILADCYQISDEAIRSMFERRVIRLTSLSLENCTISDESLDVVARNCRAIQRLNLRACSKITDAGLLSLRLLRSLKILLVSNCALVTEFGLAPMRGKVNIDVPLRPIARLCPIYLQV